MRLSRIKLPKINSLYGRIFAIFWFTMLLVLIAVLSLPHLDPRKARDIPDEHYQRIIETRDAIQNKYSKETDLGRIYSVSRATAQVNMTHDHECSFRITTATS